MSDEPPRSKSERSSRYAMLLIDIEGLALTARDRIKIQHPLVAGLILFTRNYSDADQLKELTREVRAVRPELLICVDQEGGRVQRFRQGFHSIPPMGELGARWNEAPQLTEQLVRDWGVVLASEVRACGVDFSFAPVLDLNYGDSELIGNRSFHRDPLAVCALAGALIKGFADVGVAAIGKHFPGHGFVSADSHTALPVDTRTFAELWEADLVPYRRLIAHLAGVMPAHVVYSTCDAAPAGFSPWWLQNVLRQHLGFTGFIFSDDLSMAGAKIAGSGSVIDRAEAAMRAGCDFLLVCNDQVAVDELLQHWHCPEVVRRASIALKPRPVRNYRALAEQAANRLAI